MKRTLHFYRDHAMREFENHAVLPYEDKDKSLWFDTKTLTLYYNNTEIGQFINSKNQEVGDRYSFIETDIMVLCDPYKLYEQCKKAGIDLSHPESVKQP